MEGEYNFKVKRDEKSYDERHQSQKAAQTKRYLKKTQENLNKNMKQRSYLFFFYLFCEGSDVQVADWGWP